MGNPFPDDVETQEKFKIAELKHGRIAMVAIFLYALEEAISGQSILKETAPLLTEVERLALEGPIQGNIDLAKDLAADAAALKADIIKGELFYEKALNWKPYSQGEIKILWPTAEAVKGR